MPTQSNPLSELSRELAKWTSVATGFNIDTLIRGIDGCLGNNFADDSGEIEVMCLGETYKKFPKYMTDGKWIGVWSMWLKNDIYCAVFEAGRLFTKARTIWNFDFDIHGDYTVNDTFAIGKIIDAATKTVKQDWTVQGYINATNVKNHLLPTKAGRDFSAQVKQMYDTDKKSFYFPKDEGFWPAIVQAGNLLHVPQNLNSKCYYFAFIDDKWFFILDEKGQRIYGEMESSTAKSHAVVGSKGKPFMPLVHTQLMRIARISKDVDFSNERTEMASIQNEKLKDIGSLYAILQNPVYLSVLDRFFKEDIDMILGHRKFDPSAGNAIEVALANILWRATWKWPTKWAGYNAVCRWLKMTAEDIRAIGAKFTWNSYFSDCYALLNRKFQTTQFQDNASVAVGSVSRCAQAFFVAVSDMRDFTNERFPGNGNDFNVSDWFDKVHKQIKGYRDWMDKNGGVSTPYYYEVLFAEDSIKALSDAMRSVANIRSSDAYQGFYKKDYELPEIELTSKMKWDKRNVRLSTIPYIGGIFRFLKKIAKPVLSKVADGLLEDKKEEKKETK